MAHLITKNWAEFQHYKDRSPPWIKLHKELLDDRHYQSLPLASRALAPMLWLLASETKDGSFDADPEELAFRLRTNVKDITSGLKPLIDKGFFIVVQEASSVLAGCGQVAVPETEAEREERQRKETEALASVFVLPDWIPEDTWAAYCKVRTAKKAKNEPHALGLIVKDLEGFKAVGHNPVECLNNSIKSGWAGVFEPKAKPFTAAGTVTTVPSRQERDPELTRLDIERSRSVPMPQNIREQMQKIKLGAFWWSANSCNETTHFYRA